MNFTLQRIGAPSQKHLQEALYIHGGEAMTLHVRSNRGSYLRRQASTHFKPIFGVGCLILILQFILQVRLPSENEWCAWPRVPIVLPYHY
jgi:hypothetical protein